MEAIIGIFGKGGGGGGGGAKYSATPNTSSRNTQDDDKLRKRVHIVAAVLYAVLGLTCVGLLASGRGTKTDAGYTFAADGDATQVDARTVSVAEGVVPVVCLVLGIVHTLMAITRLQWLGQLPMQIGTALVYPLLMVMLAVTSRIGDVEKLVLLFFYTMAVVTIDEMIEDPAERKRLTRSADTSQKDIVAMRAIATGMWAVPWLIVWTNVAWQTNHKHIASTALPTVLVASGFFVADQVRQWAALRYTDVSQYHSDLFRTIVTYICIGLLAFIGLSANS